MRNVATLDRADAEVAVRAVEEALRGEGRAAVIAIADAHGDPIVVVRMDGASATSVTIACNKAWTAATQDRSTRSIGARYRDPAEAFDLAYYGDERACGWAGGLPVHDRSGAVIGSVGVSGLPELDDERFASIGVAALAPRIR